jgi:hypothetical protein
MMASGAAGKTEEKKSGFFRSAREDGFTGGFFF